jgi:hypothetical protein
MKYSNIGHMYRTQMSEVDFFLNQKGSYVWVKSNRDHPPPPATPGEFDFLKNK